jgi:hypothetical protein
MKLPSVNRVIASVAMVEIGCGALFVSFVLPFMLPIGSPIPEIKILLQQSLFIGSLVLICAGIINFFRQR